MWEKQLEHKDKHWEAKHFPVSILLHDFEIKLNIGSIFRLADAFACEHVYLSGSTSVPPHRKIKKTSRSAEKYVPFSYSQNPFDVIAQLKSQSYKIVSLELTDQSIDISGLSIRSKEKVCLVLGSENLGVSQALLNESDVTVHIPMYGQLSSLNVATAAGIALYTISNCLKNA